MIFNESSKFHKNLRINDFETYVLIGIPDLCCFYKQSLLPDFFVLNVLHNAVVGL